MAKWRTIAVLRDDGRVELDVCVGLDDPEGEAIKVWSDPKNENDWLNLHEPADGFFCVEYDDEED